MEKYNILAKKQGLSKELDENVNIINPKKHKNLNNNYLKFTGWVQE